MYSLVVVADAGNPGIWSHLLPIGYRARTIKPVGFGNMGFGLPAAIAAKLARPGGASLRRLLVGDGSLGMSLAEIETAVRETTPVAIVVLNDCSYGNIKQEQLHHFGRAPSASTSRTSTMRRLPAAWARTASESCGQGICQEP